MPESVTEYAVRLVTGEIMERPSRELAESSVRGITARGGIAVLLTRQVTRSDWAEKQAEDDEDEGRPFDLGSAPDFKCFIEDHAVCTELGYDAHCTCACHQAKDQQP